MASIFGHGMVGFTLAQMASKKTSKLLLFLAIGLSILPDVDVVTFGKIPYLHPFGHRGFTHSILFAFICAAILTFLITKTKRCLHFVVLLLSMLSHGILDALTTGGKGVGFLIPFNTERFFLPWKVIRVSPIGIREFFSNWGLQVIYSELKYIGLPCLIVLLFLHFTRKEESI